MVGFCNGAIVNSKGQPLTVGSWIKLYEKDSNGSFIKSKLERIVRSIDVEQQNGFGVSIRVKFQRGSMLLNSATCANYDFQLCSAEEVSSIKRSDARVNEMRRRGLFPYPDGSYRIG